MPLSGKALLKRLLHHTYQGAVTEGVMFADVIADRQSTHLDETENSVFNSTLKLYELYKVRLENESKDIIDEINVYIATLPASINMDAKFAFNRVLNFTDPYGRLASLRKIHLSAKQALLLAYLGVTDAHALKNQTLSAEDVNNRKYSLIKTLVKTSNEYAPGSPACYGGTFHALIASLSGIHDAVTVVLDKRQAWPLALASVKLRVGEYFERWILQEAKIDEDKRLTDQSAEAKQQEMRIQAIKEEVFDGLTEAGSPNHQEYALQFVTHAKHRIFETLKKEYLGVLKETEIKDIVDAVDYIDKIDLVAPTLKDSFASRVKAIVAEQPDEKREEIKAAWGLEGPEYGDIQDVVLFAFSRSILTEFQGKLTKADIEPLLEDAKLVEIGKPRISGFLTQPQQKHTRLEDDALLSSPSLSRPFSNVLMVVAEHYGPKQGYPDALRDLLDMVSADAVAKAAIKKDIAGVNPLMKAAQNQTSGGFTVLIEKLLATEAGLKVACAAMSVVDKDGWNILMLAVGYQNSGGFAVLVEKLLATEAGLKAVCAVISIVDKAGWNVLMIAARYQTTDGFAVLIEKLLTTEAGLQAVCAAMLVVNKNGWNALKTAAHFQTTGGFTVLIEKLLATDAGLKAVCAAMSVVTNDGWNVLMTAAWHQTTGGFTVLIEKLLATDAGLKAVCAAMSVVSKEGWTMLMLAARNQTTGGFTVLIEKLLATDAGLKAVCAAMSVVSKEDWTMLMLAARNQTTDGYTVLIEKLLATEAGLKAVCAVMSVASKDGWNMLMLAARHQTTGGFTLLIEKLLVTEAGLNAVCAAMSVVTNDGLNVLKLAAWYQTTGGFTVLIEKLLVSETGLKAICAAISVVTKEGWNVLMSAAKHQTTGGFTVLIEKLLATEVGLKAVCAAMSVVTKDGWNMLMLAAQYQTTGGFTVLIEKLLATEVGLKAVCAAMSVVTNDDLNVLKLAARYQTTGGFMVLAEGLFAAEVGQAMLRRAMLPIYTVVKYQNFDTIAAFYHGCIQKGLGIGRNQLKEAFEENVNLSAAQYESLVGSASSEVEHSTIQVPAPGDAAGIPVAAIDRFLPLLLRRLVVTESGQKTLVELMQPLDSSGDSPLLVAALQESFADLKVILESCRRSGVVMDRDEIQNALDKNTNLSRKEREELLGVLSSELKQVPGLFHRRELLSPGGRLEEPREASSGVEPGQEIDMRKK